MTEIEDVYAKRFGLLDANPEFEALPPECRRMLARRTQRAYSSRAVNRELVRALLAVAMSASSKSDFQQASVIMVEDHLLRHEIGRDFPAMPWIVESPKFLVFCGDTQRLEKLGELRGHQQSNRNIEGFLNSAVDAALCMQTFILAAEAVGLGCCPISVIRNKASDIAKLLHLPDGVFPVAGLCVGYPLAEGHMSMRLPLTVTVHEDRYRDTELGEEVAAYDARREAVHPTLPAKQRNVVRFGSSARYGWSEDKTRQAAEPEGAAFAHHLLQTGFKFEAQ